MAKRETLGWMWTEALQMLAEAEHLHRQIFRPGSAAQGLVWEPPADVLETADSVLVLVALPGVDPDQAKIAVEGGTLLISGERKLPEIMRSAIIHRLELPQGRFTRRIELPAGRYSGIERATTNGCLAIRVTKASGDRS
jgi:HSP20 family protein